MNILDLARIISASLEDKIAWFQDKHLLSQHPNCPSCGAAMNIEISRIIIGIIIIINLNNFRELLLLFFALMHCMGGNQVAVS